MIIAVSGWRGWTEKNSLVLAIGSLIDDHWAQHEDPETRQRPLFRFGDCGTGVDAIMWELVTEWNLEYERYEADWEQWGKAAGPLRNRAMLKGHHLGGKGLRANLLMAFPEPGKYPRIPGSGTWGCIGEAVAMQVQTVIYPRVNLGSHTGYKLEAFRSA